MFVQEVIPDFIGKILDASIERMKRYIIFLYLHRVRIYIPAVADCTTLYSAALGLAGRVWQHPYGSRLALGTNAYPPFANITHT